MARRRSKHVPLTVLKHRRDKLARIVAKRHGKTPRGKIPFAVLARRLHRLERLVEEAVVGE